MGKIESDIVIIGGGLTGLTLAYLLKEKEFTISIIEARDRLGGRIYTSTKNEQAPIEMGATWLGAKHTALNALLEELQIGIFQQELGEKAIYEPISTSPHQLVTLSPNTDPSYRIQGGTSALINVLADYVSKDQVYFNQIVQTIIEEGDNLLIETDKQQFSASIVISTLPPYLLNATIRIQPELPQSISSIMEKTHTWMGESIKIGFRFKYPFWRTDHSSGTIVSNVGPIPEFYDHSNYEDNYYALKGFLNGTYFSLEKEERLSLVLKQLYKYYGKEVENFIDYEEFVWRKERFTHANYKDHILPHQNNGHPLYQQPFLDGKFYIAGSETADQFPGYMEGAIRSANYVYQQLEKVTT